MACINNNNFNPDYQANSAPRISFSNDFAVDAATGRPAVKYERAPAAVNSSDFEFSAGTYGMIAADELFFKGRLMPLKEQSARKNTLKDELNNGGERDNGGLIFSPAATSSRLPSRMGLRLKALMGLRQKTKHERKHHDTEDGR